MSAFSFCMKTTADSSWKTNIKEIILNIDDFQLDYNIFDTDNSVVESTKNIQQSRVESANINLDKLIINDETYERKQN